MSTIAIVGLGLIGGSLGLDFSRLGHRVVGIARRSATAETALAMGAVQQGGTDLALVRSAGVVFLCTPLDQLAPTARALSPYLGQESVVTDVGSVKTAIVEELESLCPSFVGGHPMAGKAEAGLAVAQTGLFRHRPYVLTPTPLTPPWALDQVMDLVQQLGAQIYRCSPPGPRSRRRLDISPTGDGQCGPDPGLRAGARPRHLPTSSSSGQFWLSGYQSGRRWCPRTGDPDGSLQSFGPADRPG